MKPAIFKNEELAKLGPWHVLLFEGLWCMADRKGRLEDRPERIEAEIFPFKFQKVNVKKCLEDLASNHEQFIIRYQKSGQKYIQVANFLDHQYPHIREAESTIPAPAKHHASTSLDRLTPDSGVTESPLLNPVKTSSAPERRGAVVPFWKEMIQHINDTWSRKKRGAKYVWSGKDFAALKRVLAVYQAFDVMALWDIYISSSNEFAQNQGYNVPEFVRQLPRLVDGVWKPASERYLAKLMPGDPEIVNKVKELVATLGKEIAK